LFAGISLILACEHTSYTNLTLSPLSYFSYLHRTAVILRVDLVDNFDIEAIGVTNDALVIELAAQDNAVIGYLCDSAENVVQGDIRAQGESIRVCVVPTPEALSMDVYLKQLEEFTFFRGEDISQSAIFPETKGVAADELTFVSCEPGASLCAFETLLAAAFFDGPGIVTGEGTAYLQFGQEGSTTVRRKLHLSIGGEGSPLSINSGRHLETLEERPTRFAFDILAVPVTREFNEYTDNKAQSAAVATLPSLWALGTVFAMTLYGSLSF
jgi:hypothetical protein